MKKESTFSIIWDSGASILISLTKDNYVGLMASPRIVTRLKGIVKGLSVQGKYHVMWPVLDSSGQLCGLKIPAYFLLQANVRLLSTINLLQLYPSQSIQMEAHQLMLSGTDGPGGRTPDVA